MKRNFFLIILALCFLFSACTRPQASSEDEVTKPPVATEAAPTEVPTDTVQETPTIIYDSLNADWFSYRNATDLIEHADAVFTGRVTKIDFAVLDTANGMPVSASTKDKFLHALYELEIEEVFKGDVTRIKYLKVYGGAKGINPEKQLRLLVDHGLIPENEARIPVLYGTTDAIDIPLDTPLLFVAGASLNPEMLLLLNPEQSIYPLNEPTAPQAGISVQEILSELGEDVWLDFSKDWEEKYSSTDALTEELVTDAPTAPPIASTQTGTSPPIATQEPSP